MCIRDRLGNVAVKGFGGNTKLHRKIAGVIHAVVALARLEDHMGVQLAGAVNRNHIAAERNGRPGTAEAAVLRLSLIHIFLTP